MPSPPGSAPTGPSRPGSSGGGSQSIQFFLDLDASRFSEAFKDAKKDYADFIKEVDAQNKGTIKKTQDALDGLTNSVEGFKKAMATGYTEALADLQTKMKPIVQTVSFNFRGTGGTALKAAISNAVIDALQSVKFVPGRRGSLIPNRDPNQGNLRAISIPTNLPKRARGDSIPFGPGGGTGILLPGQGISRTRDSEIVVKRRDEPVLSAEGGQHLIDIRRASVDTKREVQALQKSLFGLSSGIGGKGDPASRVLRTLTLAVRVNTRAVNALTGTLGGTPPAGAGGGGGGGGRRAGGGGGGGPGGRNLRYRNVPFPFNNDPMKWYAIQNAVGMVGGALAPGMQAGATTATLSSQRGFGYEEGRHLASLAQMGAGSGVGYGQGAMAAQAAISSRMTADQQKRLAPLLAAAGQAGGVDPAMLAGLVQQVNQAGLGPDAGALAFTNAIRMNPHNAPEALQGLTSFVGAAQPWLRKTGQVGMTRALGLQAQFTKGIGKKAGFQAAGQISEAMMGLIGRGTNLNDAQAQQALAVLTGGRGRNALQRGDTDGFMQGFQQQASMFNAMPAETRHAALSAVASMLNVDVNQLDVMFASAAEIAKVKPADQITDLNVALADMSGKARDTINWVEALGNKIGGLFGAAGETPAGTALSHLPGFLQTGANIANIIGAFRGRGGGGGGGGGPSYGPAMGGVGAGLGNASSWSTLGKAGKFARGARIGGGALSVAAGGIGMLSDISDPSKTNWADWVGNAAMIGGGLAMGTGAGALVGIPLALLGSLLKSEFGGATESAMAVDANGAMIPQTPDGRLSVSDEGTSSAISQLAAELRDTNHALRAMATSDKMKLLNRITLQDSP